MPNETLKKKKKIVELEFMQLKFQLFFLFLFFKSLIAPYWIFYKSSFTLKLDFEKIEFQNKDINLNSFKIWTYC